jgi:hypothetical protein
VFLCDVADVSRRREKAPVMTPGRLRCGSFAMRPASGAGQTSIGRCAIKSWSISSRRRKFVGSFGVTFETVVAAARSRFPLFVPAITANAADRAKADCVKSMRCVQGSISHDLSRTTSPHLRCDRAGSVRGCHHQRQSSMDRRSIMRGCRQAHDRKAWRQRPRLAPAAIKNRRPVSTTNAVKAPVNRALLELPVNIDVIT